jgi:hypothetical protein
MTPNFLPFEEERKKGRKSLETSGEETPNFLKESAHLRSRFPSSFQQPRPLKVKKEVRLDSEKSCLMPKFVRDLAHVPGETPQVPQEMPHEPQAGGLVPQDPD